MKINFYYCNIPDELDADVYAAEPLRAWLGTEHGKWVVSHAHDLTWHKQPDVQHWGTDIVVRGELRDPRLITEYFLRWPDKR